MAKNVTGNKSIRNNKLIYLVIAVLSLMVFIGILSLLRSLFTTETYYILNTNVPTRTQISVEMLDPITASEGSAPEAAIGIDEVQTGTLYTKFPLLAGDILTESNVGGFEDISTGVPDEWVITNFSVSADDAVGGRIQRGYYFDMMVATADKSFYPFINMLVLDTSVSMRGASSAQAVDTQEAKDGQTSQYTVGMSPSDAAILHNIMEQHGGNIKLVMSPRQNEYNTPQLSEYQGDFVYEETTKNAGEGTDNSFRPIERDKFGRPIENLAEDCSVGNRRMSAEECKAAAEEQTTQTEEQTTQDPETDDEPSIETPTPIEENIDNMSETPEEEN